MIRARLFAVPLLLLAAASAAPSAGPQTHAQLDVPRAKPQQVIVQSRDFAPGSESGWHVHPGTEVAYIASGRLELHVEGKVTVLEPGDSFTMPRGVPHNGVNAGADPARAVVTLVVDKGAQPRQPVAAPRPKPKA
ncbi:MAG: cupin domain-containing protein [Sphingomonadales bacterium]|nr:cupin domain-containing protein [Sphingomonadales bacterium]